MLFLSIEIKGITLPNTADPRKYPKRIYSGLHKQVQTAPNCASHSDEIICSFFAQQASMPTTHDDEDLLQIDEDAMEEIDIRWQGQSPKISQRLWSIMTVVALEFKFVDERSVILIAPRKKRRSIVWIKKNIIPSRWSNFLVAMQHRMEAVLCTRNWGKQHRASCKKIEERIVREPLELLHMDLFGPVSVESVNRKKYCLVVTDDCSKFSWVFFLAYKDETYDMLHDLIVGLENKLRHKVKTIRCDHGTEFKNHLMNEFWSQRKESERNIMCKSEEGYLLGYSTSSKGFRVYNRVTRKVQDCLHKTSLEDQENQKGKGPPSMNYIPVRKENYADSGGKVSTYDDVEDLDDQQFIVHGPSINAAQNKHSEERTADKEVPFVL
ncbi:putative ribonuclease H-like domain-containing protein [Tanacetum coccineum]